MIAVIWALIISPFPLVLIVLTIGMTIAAFVAERRGAR